SEIVGRYPVVGEGVPVAEPPGHPAWGERPNGLEDREEERLLLLPLLLRVDEDLHLGKVQVPEQLLRHEVGEWVILHLVVPGWFRGIGLHPPPARFESAENCWNDRGHDGPRGIPEHGLGVFAAETECEFEVVLEGAEAGL